MNSRTGEFHVVSAKATIVCTNAITFRSGFVRDITGTGTLLAYSAGAGLRNAEFSYVRPGTPSFYFRGASPSPSKKVRAGRMPKVGGSCATMSRSGATSPTCRASPAPWRWKRGRPRSALPRHVGRA